LLHAVEAAAERFGKQDRMGLGGYEVVERAMEAHLDYYSV